MPSVVKIDAASSRMETAWDTELSARRRSAGRAGALAAAGRVLHSLTLLAATLTGDARAS